MKVGVGVDLNEGGADVADPAHGFEGDVAVVADDDHPTQLARGAVVAASTPVAPYSVVDDEVPAVDVELEAVADGNDGTARCRRV
jgi:hypothetical protein